MNVKETLKKYFGFDSFKEGQEEIMNALLKGQDVLAVMPTGSGKSICYQVPALLLDGITVVISPLISLMQDQVKALNEAGIHAGYINSSLTESQISKAYSNAKLGEYKIMYVAPERLETYDFEDFAKSVNISMVTVDEAHCISQWGQDFRPSYLKIIDFVNSLEIRPIISAFTATATEEVKTDISCVLNLNNPKIVVTGFDRENLYFSVENIKKKDDYIVEYVKKHPDESGIIYCATRKNVDSVFELLAENGVDVTRYHAGMGSEERKNNQNDFIYDICPVIVATNAFGMGINKTNVRYVIHYNMPQSMENYYQEAGRAGRDGEPSRCILLFSPQDIMINRFLLDHKDFTDIAEEDIELIRQRDTKRLQVIEGYCKTTGCLRNYILDYFGEKRDEPCDNCGNCHREFIEKDMTTEAKQVINCVYETKGRYGISIVLGILLGANRARLKELGTNSYRTFGVLRNYTESELKALVSQMIFDGYLVQTEDRYSVLKMGNIMPLKESGAKIIVRTYEEKIPEKNRRQRRSRGTDSLTRAGYELFGELKSLRLQIAREEAVPPYIVFSDKTLIDMCVKTPKCRNDMLSVLGVGETKNDKYGERFIVAIEAFLNSHPGAVISIRDEHEGREIVTTEKKNRKGKKLEFYLTQEDAEKFEYSERYYVSEIKDELNRIASSEIIKKVTTTPIYGFLITKGYIAETETDKGISKVPTDLGASKGIEIIDKVSPAGNEYSLLMYPPEIQKEIVSSFVKDNNNSVENMEADDYLSSRVVYNRTMNRPDGAGAAWTEEEDKQLDEEYQSGMSLAEIAKKHDRTRGGIISRLKKHGLID